MRIKFYSFALLFFLTVSTAFAQLEIDKSLNLSGTGVNAKISGIDTTFLPKDAVSAKALQRGALIYADGGGTASAYTVDLAPAVTSYTTGMVVNFKAVITNSGPVTLSVNGLTGMFIKKNVTTDLSSGDIATNQLVSVIYDGANFQLLAGSATSGSGHYIQNNTVNGTFGTGQAASFDIMGNGELNGSLFVNGSVGVGTVTAPWPISILKTNEWNIVSRSANAVATNRNHIMMQRANNTSAVTAGFNLGGIGMGGYDGTSYSFGWDGGAEITAFANQTWTPTARGTYLTFTTTSNNSATPAERVRIGADGNVGIGITTPSAKLSMGTGNIELLGSAASTMLKTHSGTLPSAANSRIKLASFGFASANYSSFGIEALRQTTGSDWTTVAIGIKHDVDNTSPVNNAELWLAPNGNVGIGTSTPVSKLEVNGAITGFGVVPIGTVVAWMESTGGTPALPAGWVRCNGQVLSDGASPYNGQTIPNLNGGNQFLRGNTNSAGSGGAATHAHGINIQQTSADHAPDASNHTNGTIITTAAASSLPPYRDVVWIIRVK